MNIAIRAAIRARKLYEALQFSKSIGPDGVGRTVHFKDTAELYDYFEECFVVVVFSFQALEAFANQTIAHELKTNYELKRGKEVRLVTPDELERVASTEEKVGVVLPTVLSVSSPKGTKTWGAFINLKRTRDASIHLKSYDQYPNRSVEEEQRRSLFQQFLVDSDIAYYPRAAVNMISHFCHGDRAPRWLGAARETCPGLTA